MPAPPLDPSLLQALESALLRRVSIQRIGAAGGRAGSAKIDSIEVGRASIEKVTIENFTTEVHCGSALLKDMRAILELHFEVRWSYDLKLFGSDQGVKALGSKAKTIPLHDIRIPMLQDLKLEVPTADAASVEATVLPVTDVALGGLSFDGLEIRQARLPSSGFQVAGFGFASIEVDRFGAPDADSASVAIANFSPDDPLRLPDVRVSNIDIPQVAIPDVGSPEAVSIMDIQPETFEAPVFKIGDFFKAIFVATPVLHIQIGELILSDLLASASVGSVQVAGLKVPVSAHGVHLADVALTDFAAEGITI